MQVSYRVGPEHSQRPVPIKVRASQSVRALKAFESTRAWKAGEKNVFDSEDNVGGHMT